MWQEYLQEEQQGYPYMLFNGTGTSTALDQGIASDEGVANLVRKLKSRKNLPVGTYEIVTIRNKKVYKRQFSIQSKPVQTFIEWN